MIEKKVVIGGVELSYMRKPARYDAKHLVVVFSGFSGNGKPTYNHSNTLTLCPAEVVWIKDDFFGGETYYLCANGKFNIEAIVYEFITSILHELNLDVSDCTLLGGSKGGSAAMYFGFKYNFGNIIAAVPQFHIGSYVEKYHSYAYKHMTGDLPTDDARDLTIKLDHMIADVIKTSNPKKNVYLVSSLADTQYETEIVNNVDQLRKFSNFNLIMANSGLIRQHNQVVVHTLSTIISIVNLCATGMSPQFSEENIKFRELSAPKKPALKALVRLKKFRVAGDRYYPEGISVIRGISCENYGDISIKLILSNNDETISIGLAKGSNPNLTRELFDGDLVIYDKGWFCTLRYEGLPIDDLPLGVWSCHIEVFSKGFVRQAPLTSDKDILCSGEGATKRMVFSASTTQASFTVSSK